MFRFFFLFYVKNVFSCSKSSSSTLFSFYCLLKIHYCIKFGGPSVLQVQSIEEPKLQAKEVLVAIKAVGINPVETYIRAGAYARLPNLPYTPGSDGAGVIDKIGDDVSGWNVGDRVYLSGSLSGTYAEKAVCSSDQIHKLPDHISFEQGASIYIPYATAYASIFQRAQYVPFFILLIYDSALKFEKRAKPGESILIHGGSGGVGLASIQLAKAKGLRVLATASSTVNFSNTSFKKGVTQFILLFVFVGRVGLH